MENTNNKKQNFLAGAAVLSLATMVVKVIGMFFKIPLNRLIGEANYGYFTTAYDIYTVLLMISTTGLPVAMSRMVSEAKALGNGRQIRQIYRVSLSVFMGIGIIGTLAMTLFPQFLADKMRNPDAAYSILALGPAVFFVCFLSACRGLFQGQGNMTPTAVSQVIEALCKLFLGLGLAWLVMKQTSNGPLAAAGSIAGVTIGAVLAALYLFVKTRRSMKDLSRGNGAVTPAGKTMKTLLAIAVPITLGSAGLQIIGLFDSATIMTRLMDSAGYTQAQADVSKGIYNYCQTIFNFPCAFIPCITVAIIPAITNHLTLKNMRGVRMVQNSSLRLMGLIAMPCAVGLIVLAEPVVALLGGYTGENLAVATKLLALLGVAVVFNSIVLMTDAIMQAHNHVVIPVINTLIGGVIRVIINYILVGNPAIAIVGAPFGAIGCTVSITVLNLIAMRRVLKEPPKLLQCTWKSAVAAIVMGIATFAVYRGLSVLVSSTIVCCLGAIIVAVVVYVLLVVMLKVLTYDDCMLLPKGEKIAKILRIH